MFQDDTGEIVLSPHVIDLVRVDDHLRVARGERVSDNEDGTHLHQLVIHRVEYLDGRAYGEDLFVELRIYFDGSTAGSLYVTQVQLDGDCLERGGGEACGSKVSCYRRISSHELPR